MKPKLAELIINDEQNEDAFAEPFVYEPETIEEERLGNFYIVGEATTNAGNRAEPTYLLNLLASKASRKYYERSRQQTPKTAFAATLKEINHLLFDLMDKGELAWLDGLHITLATLQDSDLIFAQSGRNATLILRDGVLNDIGKVFAPHGGMLEDEQFFKNIASGKLKKGDQLIFATPALLRNLREEEVKNLLTRYHYDQYLDQDRTLVRGLMRDYHIQSLSAIVFWFDEEPAPAASAPAAKQETAVVTAPPTPRHDRAVTRKKWGLIKKWARWPALVLAGSKKPPAVAEEGQKPPAKKAPLIPVLDQVKTKSSLLRWMKYLLPAVALTLIAIGGWLFLKPGLFIKPEQKLADLNAQFQSLLTASLVDPSGAQSQLDATFEQAQQLANEVEVGPLQDALAQLGFIIPLTNIQPAETLIDFEKLSLSFRPRGIIANPNRLIIFSQDNLYVFDLGTKQGAFMTLPEVLVPFLKDAAYNSEAAINYLLDPKNLFTLQGEPARLDQQELAPASDKETPLAMASYAGHLYVLARAGDQYQILKYRNAETSRPPVRWLKEESRDVLHQPIDLTIDGSIWVAEKSGRVLKLTKGRLESQFKLPFDEQFTAGLRLWTNDDADSPFLWVLAPKLHRLFLMRKDGNLEAIFAAANFNSPEDFAVQDKTVYVVNGLTVLKMNLPVGGD